MEYIEKWPGLSILHFPEEDKHKVVSKLEKMSGLNNVSQCSENLIVLEQTIMEIIMMQIC